MSSYQAKYIKYKQKYINLKTQLGGTCPNYPLWDKDSITWNEEKKEWNIPTLIYIPSDIPPFISQKYSITPKDYDPTKKYDPLVIKITFDDIYNDNTLRLKAQRERIKIREDRKTKITDAIKSYWGICYGDNRKNYKTVLDKLLEIEETERTIESLNLTKMKEMERASLKQSEKDLIDAKLETIIETDSLKKLQEYKKYQDSIILCFDANKYYLQSKIDELTELTERIKIDLKLKEFLTKNKLDERLQEYKNYKNTISTYSENSKQYLQSKINELTERISIDSKLKELSVKSNLNERLKKYIEYQTTISTYSENSKQYLQKKIDMLR